MKALKEKRIRLRSLWRRGLVILSLFALVFAGCSDSSDGGVTTSLKTIVGAALLQAPDSTKEVQYEGFPVDLTGMKILVRYNDNSTEEISDTGRFYSAAPYYDSRYTSYRVYLETSHLAQYYVDVSYAAKGIKAVDQIHWHGSLDKATYFSDDFPDFSGITLEMRYDIGGHDGLYHKMLALPKEWQNWRFSERAEPNEPFVNITFPNVSSTIPLDKIYYVDTLTFDPAPAFTDIEKMQIFVSDTVTVSGAAESSVFNTSKVITPNANASITGYPVDAWLQNAWINRLGSDTKLKVTYTDTDVTKTYTQPELLTLRDWTPLGYGAGASTDARNPRLMVVDVPYYVGVNVGNTPINKNDNYVDNKKGCTITFAYRGVKMEPIEIPVFGQFVNITATSKTDEDVEYHIYPKANWPDPVAAGGDDIRSLWSKIDVKAWYGLYTDKGTTASKTLSTYNDDPASTTPWPLYGSNVGTDGILAGKVQGDHYDIRTSFADIWNTNFDPGLGAAAVTKEKAYKVTVSYQPPAIFMNSATVKTAKVSVNFVEVLQ